MVVWRSGRVWSFGCRVVYGREQSSSTGLSNLVGEYGWSDLICSGYLLNTMLTVQCSRWCIVYLWVTHYASINDMCSMYNWASLMIPLAVYWPGVYYLPMTVFTYSTVYPWLCSHTALFTHDCVHIQHCLPMTVFTYSTVYPWLCSHTALFLAHFL